MNENTNTAFVPTGAEQKRMQEEGRKSSMLFGIAAGAVMLVIGLPAVFSPLAVGITLACMVTAGLGVYGITQIAAWAKTPAEQRGSAAVVSGMFLTGFSLLTLWASFQTRFGFAGLIAGPVRRRRLLHGAAGHQPVLPLLRDAGGRHGGRRVGARGRRAQRLPRHRHPHKPARELVRHQHRLGHLLQRVRHRSCRGIPLRPPRPPGRRVKNAAAAASCQEAAAVFKVRRSGRARCP